MELDLDASSPARNLFREFTPWLPWASRRLSQGGHGYPTAAYAGVYLLALFDVAPPDGPADYLEERVVYVGEGGNLRRRWDQFEASARHGKQGHSGGFRFRHRPDCRWDHLHVAALPIWFGPHDASTSLEDWSRTFRLHVERRIIWELTIKRGGCHRLLNQK